MSRYSEWLKENPQVQRAYKKAVDRANPEGKRLRVARHSWKIKMRVIDILGGKCSACGNSDVRVLQVNHLNGGGSKENRGGSLYRRIVFGKRGISDLNLLCANCNILYEYEKGNRYQGIAIR